MAPRGGRGGVGGGGGGGGRSRGVSSFNESQVEITSLYGRNGTQNSVYTQSEITGSMAVYVTYLLCVFFALVIIKNVKKPRPANDKRKRLRFTWICALQLVGLLFSVSLGLPAARWALLSGDNKVGVSFRIEEPLTELFRAFTEVILLSIMARFATLVLAGLVPRSGPDPALAKLRKWANITVIGLLLVLVVVIGAQVAMGFVLAVSAFEAHQYTRTTLRYGIWRLGDRDVATQLSSMGADAKYLSGVSDSRSEIWEPLIRRFTTLDWSAADWRLHREVQIALEVTRNVLMVLLILEFGYLAFKKRHISNQKDNKNLIVRHSSTIVRCFLYIVFPSLLITSLVSLATSVHFNVHNFQVITAGIHLTNNDSFFPSYRTTFKGFPIFMAVLKNFGWVATFVMLSILTRWPGAAKTKPVVPERARKEVRESGMPYAQLAAMKEREPKKKSIKAIIWK